MKSIQRNWMVTGGLGFIGSNFMMYIVNAHPNDNFVIVDSMTYAAHYSNVEGLINESKGRIKFIKADICDKAMIADVFTKHSITTVVNFAAESHVDNSITGPDIFIKSNVLGTQTLLECAKSYWKDGIDSNGYPTYKKDVRFHQVSTDEVYGSLGATGYFTEQTPICPHSPYSASKASADLIVQAYVDTFHFPATISRCSNNYGPLQDKEKLIPHVVWCIMNDEDIPVYGTGNNVRDWLYVNDHCTAIDTIVTKAPNGTVWNIGGNNEQMNIDIVSDIISIVMKETGKVGKIKFVSDRLGHDHRYAIDSTKLQSELDWKPSANYKEHLRDTIVSYIEQFA